MRMFALLLAAACALLAACQDPQERLAEHQKRGEQDLAQKQWHEADLEFHSMLEIDPNDASAHWGLARALIGEKELGKAYWEIQETVRLDPKNVDARLHYGEFLLTGKSEELHKALDNADAVLKLRPKEWRAQIQRARALQALHRPQEAGESLRLATEAAPNEAAPRLLYANHLRVYGKAADAEAQFRKLTEQDPKGFTGWAALAAFLSTQKGRDAEALAAYHTAVERATPEKLNIAYSALASFLMSRGRNDEAEQTLRDGVAAAPDDVDLIYTLARFYHATGRRKQADEMIQKATQARPHDVKPLLLLSAYRAANDDLDGALAAAEQATQVAPEDTSARLRKAEVLVDIGYRRKQPEKVAAGRAVVQAVLAKQPGEPRALFVEAKIDLAQGKNAEAEASLRQALDKRPDWPQAHFLLGSALFIAGDRTGARSEVARALELDGSLLAAQKMMFRIHASLGDHQLAVETGRKVLARTPDDDKLRVEVAQSLVRLRRLDAARKELLKIPEARRGAEAWYAIGRVQRLQGNAAAAYAALKQAQEKDPGRYEVLHALFLLDAPAGRLADSQQRVAAALETHPDDARLTRLQGEMLLVAGEREEAEKQLRRAIALDPNDLASYQSLARYLALTGHQTEVIETYEKALAANPKSGSLQLVVGSLYEMQGRKKDAMARYEKAIQLDPKLAIAKNNLAYLLAERGEDLDRALDLAQKAKALLPDNPNTADTLGWVLYKKGVAAAAIGYLKEAAQNMPPEDPNVSLVRHHLGLAYLAHGEPERARETWQQALQEIEARGGKEPPWTGDIRKGLAGLKTS